MLFCSFESGSALTRVHFAKVMNALKCNGLVAEAARLRDRAEECRALADIVGDETAKASYLRLTAAYETLASHEERIRSKVCRNPANRTTGSEE